MKKVISFDLDGTISDKTFSEFVWTEGIPIEFSKRHGIPFEKAKAFILKAYEEIGDRNLLWYDIKYWLKRFDLEIDPDELLKRYEDTIRFLPHAEEVLSELNKKFRLILTSNAARIFVEKQAEVLKLERYFEKILSATSDYGMVKTERFFLRLTEDLSIPKEEIIHIGDHPFFDFLCPSSVGIKAFLIDSKRNLREVLDLI